MSQQPSQHPVAQAANDALAALPGGAGLVVGVSGGLDSVALLQALHEALGPGAGARLTVAHLDHTLRADSPADAAFVAGLADRMHLPFLTERLDVPDWARRHGLGLEEAARDLRYDFFLRCARETRAAFVALAHHADDNVETVLYRIVRGTALRGLGGMPAARPLGEGVTLIRPLLACRREQIEHFARSRGLAWRTDSTNADTRLARNYIRHTLLPALRDRLNGRADEAIARLAAAAAAAADLLARQGLALLEEALRPGDAGALSLSASVLAEADPLIVAEALREALTRLDAGLKHVSADHLRAAAALPHSPPPATVGLPGNLEVRRRGDLLILSPVRSPAPDSPADRSPIPGDSFENPLDWSLQRSSSPSDTTEIPLPDGSSLHLSPLPFDRVAFERHLASPDVNMEFLDADRLASGFCLRLARPEETFIPLGAPGRQSVAAFLANAKVPRRARAGVFCLADAEGIVWLIGHRLADRVKVSPATAHVLLARHVAWIGA
ncbi:MAG: tRNA lysidine(34) synthetase TilS [Planctomycetota bacterium]|nr:tRNA lysidine(34) synthetase TilS [Planctomycetota bacterium]